MKGSVSLKTRNFLAAVVSVAVACLAASPASASAAADRARIEQIFAAHDKLQAGLDEYMASVASDIILMPNGGAAIEGKAAYLQHVKDFYASGKIQIRHELIEVYSYPEVVIARGRAVGKFTPHGGSTTSAFETKNVFIFRRLENGNLEVWQIIFNDAPAPSRQ
jgi:ketosteroid isomerase-like protein